MSEKSPELEGEVTGLGSSPEGDIAFIFVRGYGAGTVLLNATCWQESEHPKKGEIIMVRNLTRFKKGWRATSARKFTLADQV